MKQAFYFYANPYQPHSEEAARALERELAALGGQVFSDTYLSQKGIGREASLTEAASRLQAVIAFGGDGTLLRIAPHAAALSLPLLGVHTGTVGFLMDGNAAEPQEIARSLMKKSYRTSLCPMLEVEFEGQTYLALNDIALSRGEHPGVVEVSVWADDEKVYASHGDGMLISTPLGSTAYCLAAGGPIVRPDTPCLIVTPLCSRELLQRSVVLPLDAKITLTAHGRSRRRLQLAIDGQTLLPVTDEAAIHIAQAPEKMNLITLSNRHFFSTLRQKQALWNQQEQE